MDDIIYSKKIESTGKPWAIAICKELSEYLKNNDLEGFLDIVNNRYNTRHVSACAQFLVENGVDIFKYMRDIPLGTFYMSTLKYVNIPSNIRSIGPKAFFSTDLEEITIPGNIKVIGYNAFENCMKLQKIVIEEGVETICSEAFADIGSNANQNVKIYLPNSVTYMHPFTFLDSLHDIIVYCPEGSYAYEYCINLNLNYKVI